MLTHYFPVITLCLTTNACVSALAPRGLFTAFLDPSQLLLKLFLLSLTWANWKCHGCFCASPHPLLSWHSAWGPALCISHLPSPNLYRFLLSFHDHLVSPKLETFLHFIHQEIIFLTFQCFQQL